MKRFNELDYIRSIYYLKSITYCRLSEKKLKLLIGLLELNDQMLIEEFVERELDEESRYSRYRKLNPQKFDSYYKFRKYNLSLSFRILEVVLDNKKSGFELYRKTNKISQQLELFKGDDFNEKNIKKLEKTPKIIFTGQRKIHYNSKSCYKKVNFLDSQSILEIVDFFKTNELLNKYVLIKELRKITQEEFYEIRVDNIRCFIKFSELIEIKSLRNESFEDIIWSISDGDWCEYNYSVLSIWLDSFHKKLVEFYEFLITTIKYENYGLMLKLEFYE